MNTLRIIFVLGAFLACANALALGDPIVLYSMAGQLFVLILTTIFILASKAAWRRRMRALVPIAVGGGVVFSISSLPDYRDNAELIEVLCIILTLLSALAAILILRRVTSTPDRT